MIIHPNFPDTSLRMEWNGAHTINIFHDNVNDDIITFGWERDIISQHEALEIILDYLREVL